MAEEKKEQGLGASEPPATLGYRGRSASEEEEFESNQSRVLYQILDKNQKIIEKCKVKRDGVVDENSILNQVDPDWNYNITMGDIEKRRISNLPGLDPEVYEDIWFPMKDSVRKVFVALKVKRVSGIDNIAETFRMRFHIYFNWLMTEEDYRSHMEAEQKVKETRDPQYMLDWEPTWYPHLEFQNAIEEHRKEWELYPEEGRFRKQKFKDFGKKKKEKIDEDKFDCEHARFVRAKLECEMTFAEELEHLSCIIHERTTTGVECRFLPELRKATFASVDPRYSVIDEWDLETAVLEFGDANPGASRSKTVYPMITLRLKMKRRWQVFIWNVVFLVWCICGLSLCAYALTKDDLGERLNLIVTLVLTAVAFSYVVFESLPNVPYLTYLDKYILFGYGFLIATMLQSTFFIDAGETAERVFFWFFLAYFFGYNGVFAWYAFYLRNEEQNKLYYSSDEVEREVNLSRPGLEFNYEKRLRAGTGGRLLSYIGTIKIPKEMKADDQVRLRLQQEKLEKIYEQRATKVDAPGLLESMKHTMRSTGINFRL